MVGTVAVYGRVLPGGVGAEQTVSPELPELPTPDAASTDPAPKLVCSLLRMCRVPANDVANAQKSDVGRLLLGPAVAS